MNKHIAIIMILLFALLSGGCAVIPALVTTGASFAVPQTISLAMTAAGTVHKTVLYAADERNTGEIISDKMKTIQAQAMMLDEQISADATCLNGDIYVVGEYSTPAARDHVIEELQSIEGVNSVKGALKPMPTKLSELVEPTIADTHAETVIETGLLAKLHVKSANVDVEVVQGEAFIIGVVEDAAEAQSVVNIVEGLRPKSDRPLKVTSLLALQDSYEAEKQQPNQIFALLTQSQMLAAATPEALPLEKTAQKVHPTLVASNDAPQTQTLATKSPAQISPNVLNKNTIDKLSLKYAHLERSSWQNARVHMKRKILSLSKTETDPRTKKELISLSTRILKDKYTSIEDRLVKTLHATNNLTVKRHVDTILSDIAPQRTLRLHDLAMN